MSKKQKQSLFPTRPQLAHHASESSNEISELKAELKSLNQRVSEKQNQLFLANKKLRQEGIKNQKLKKEVIEADERVNEFVNKQIEFLFEKYKSNTNSPLFHNENGLSPFELLRIGQKKFDTPEENIICMVCFSDLAKGCKILKLPCTHIVHKQCGIQHLLYCKQCPACSADLK